MMEEMNGRVPHAEINIPPEQFHVVNQKLIM